MKKVRNIPKFKNEKEESAFWQKADSTKYLDWKKATIALFPDLKPSTKSISIRLPDIMLSELKQLANKRDIPYQSFIKMILQDRIDYELKGKYNKN